jgi:hypothetical protein
MRFDRNGVQLANVPNAGVSRRNADTDSGNANHDIRSGKFAPGGRPDQRPTAPANVDPLEYQRMLDAVRDAAREFDGFDEGDIREFVSGRANAPDVVDIRQFMEMVTEQRKSDLVDMLDQILRVYGSAPRGRRKVRVSAPKGFIRKSLNGLDPDDLANVMHRLEARGHTTEDVERFFEGRTKNLDRAKERRDTLTASDNWWEDPFDSEATISSDQPIIVNVFANDQVNPDLIADEIRFRLR